MSNSTDYDFGDVYLSYDVPRVLDDLGISGVVNGEWLNFQCPFHDDKNPSFGIHFMSGNWNCFSCGSGFLDEFVSQVKNISLTEAVEYLSGFVRDADDEEIATLQASQEAMSLLEAEDLSFSRFMRENKAKFDDDIYQEIFKNYDILYSFGDIGKLRTFVGTIKNLARKVG